MVVTLTEVSRRKANNLPQRVEAGGVGVLSFGSTAGGMSLFVAGKVGKEPVSGESRSGEAGRCVSVDERLLAG